MRVHAADALQKLPIKALPPLEDESPASVSAFTESDNYESKASKFTPKVPPTDYQRFIYKCNDCMLGFKRRGMLVNHMAKQHPDVSMDSVHELSLPILQTQRCYYCQYCDKEYRSSSKRKAHILKYHPGRELPQSMRQREAGGCEKAPAGGVDLTYSKSIGNVVMHAYRCEWCHKQYASKTRLQQHQRKQHNDELQRSLLLEKQHVAYESRYHYQSAAETHAQSANAYFREAEPENKLLKLSSAALGFQLFERDSEIASGTFARDDCGYKMDEYVEASTTSNCDLNPLPQLFEDINYVSLRGSQFAINGAKENF